MSHASVLIFWPLPFCPLQLLLRPLLLSLLLVLNPQMGVRRRLRTVLQEKEKVLELRVGQRRTRQDVAAKLHAGCEPVCTTASLPASILSPVRTMLHTSLHLLLHFTVHQIHSDEITLND